MLKKIFRPKISISKGVWVVLVFCKTMTSQVLHLPRVFDSMLKLAKIVSCEARHVVYLRHISKLHINYHNM